MLMENIMKQKIKTELHENRQYVYMSILITVLTILPQLYFSPFLVHTIFLAVTGVWLFSISKFSKILFSILIIFINLSNVFVTHIAMHWGYYKADLSPRIETMMLSPKYEQLEYLKSFVDLRDFAFIIYTIVVLLLLVKYIRHYKHSFKTVKTIGITVFIILTISFSPYHDHVEKPEPFSIPSKYFKISKDDATRESVLKRKENLSSEKISINEDANTTYDKVVVIVGESVNKRHMGLYGYKVDTTPFLSSMYRQKKIYRFDAISSTNQTSYSVPILLTESHVEDFQDAYEKSHSIITDFCIQGYTTYWISNQGKRGDSKIVTIADEADKQFFANQGYYIEAKTDQAILDHLQKIPKNDKKEMYVLHLIGSHGAYTHRYTQDHTLYTDPENIVQKYDNTIYYTDYIIKNIIKYFKGKKVLVAYVSDHGEVINTDKNGHGFLPAYKDEYEVPFLIYSSIKNERIDELVRNNVMKRINLENFNYMLQYLSGISDENNVSYAPEVFTVHPENVVNYETLEFLGE